jgi:hypothetical protein
LKERGEAGEEGKDNAEALRARRLAEEVRKNGGVLEERRGKREEGRKKKEERRGVRGAAVILRTWGAAMLRPYNAGDGIGCVFWGRPGMGRRDDVECA